MINYKLTINDLKIVNSQGYSYGNFSGVIRHPDYNTTSAALDCYLGYFKLGTMVESSTTGLWISTWGYTYKYKTKEGCLKSLLKQLNTK